MPAADLIKAAGRGAGAGVLILALGGAAGSWWSAVPAGAPPDPAPILQLSEKPAPTAASPPLLAADFGEVEPTGAARQVADSIVQSRDHGGVEFLIVDKKAARLYVFDAQGRLQADSAILVGSAVGDTSVPGIGERLLGEIRPAERTTPAGRHLAERGLNLGGEAVIWVDYDAGISMHAVRSNNRAERRLERLASASPEDNRISYGCINVPHAFFGRHVLPLFERYRAVVYVLPDTLPLESVFASILTEPQTTLRSGDTRGGIPVPSPDPSPQVPSAGVDTQASLN